MDFFSNSQSVPVPGYEYELIKYIEQLDARSHAHLILMTSEYIRKKHSEQRKWVNHHILLRIYYLILYLYHDYFFIINWPNKLN